MEHVERQNEREDEIRGEVDGLEQRGDKMEERGHELDEQIGSTREEWEQKQRSEDVPGAQPAGGHDSGSEPPPEADITPGDPD